jgi:fatty acid synthase
MAPTSGEIEPGAVTVPAMKEVDILGLSCRFPESANASEFWDNLAQGKDMVTSNDKRWPVGLHGTPPRSGKVPDFERFDASFFSVHGKQAQVGIRLPLFLD